MSEFDQDHIATGNRYARRFETDREDTDAAIDTGQVFDRRGDEWDRAASTGELDEWPTNPHDKPISARRELASYVRSFFEARGDIKDPGSVDVAFIEKIGVDVCAMPDFLEILIDEAKAHYSDIDGKVKIDDVLQAAVIVEHKQMEFEQTQEAGFVLIDHGVEESEISALIESDPHKARSIARLLKSPILGTFNRRVTQHVMEQGSRYSLEQITETALQIMRNYNRHQAALEAGDPAAIEHQRLLMRLPEMRVALGEMLVREEFETDRLPKDLPNPEAV